MVCCWFVEEEWVIDDAMYLLFSVAPRLRWRWLMG